MKQKYNQVKAKANGVQKGNIVKKQKNERAVVQVMDSVAKNSKQLKVVTKNNQNKNTQKKTLPPKKGLPPKKVIVVAKEEELEEEENSDSKEDSGADIQPDANEAASDLEEESDNEDMAEVDDEEQESDEDDDAEEEDDKIDAEESAEEEDDDDASSDDEAPVEESITKSKADKNAKQIDNPKIKCSDIPIDFPNDQVVLVKKLPKKGGFKQVDLVEVFGKYGTLHTVRPYYFNNKFSIAYIAYTTAEAAKAALAADKTEINGAVVSVVPRPLDDEIKQAQEKKKQEAEKKKLFVESADRSLYIRNLKTDTKEPALREHFASCGEIESVKIVGRGNLHKGSNYAFITFSDSDSAQAALKLNNSVLNNATIGVYMSGVERTKVGAKNPKCTVILKNLQQFESFPGDKIEAIFAKCGEIDNIDIACMKNVLAFISFKNEDSVPKALALNETVQDDLQIEVTEYQLVQKEPNTSVFMINVKPGTTESEIREFFADTGDISSIYLKSGFAIVKFANTDGFCKAFLQNEKRLSGQQVFLKPYSDPKKRIGKVKKGFGANKRPYPFHKKDGGNKFKKPNFKKV